MTIPPCYLNVIIESFEIMDVTGPNGSLLKLKVKWHYTCTEWSEAAQEHPDVEQCPDGQSCERTSPTMTSIQTIPMLAIIPEEGADGGCMKCIHYCGSMYKDKPTQREKCLDMCANPGPNGEGVPMDAGRQGCPDGLESVISESALNWWWYGALVNGRLGYFGCPCLPDFLNDMLDKDYWKINNILRASFDELCKRYNSN